MSVLEIMTSSTRCIPQNQLAAHGRICACYLVDKNVVEVIGQAAGESVSQLSKQELLLRHSHQFVVSCRR